MMLRLTQAPKLRHYLVAGLLAIAIPMALGHAIYRADPAACYDSPCALPLLLLVVPPVVAPVLPVLFAINRQLARPLPDGWLPTVLMSGVTGQIAISLSGVALASPNIRRIFLWDTLFIPQGLIVGLTMGAVFWVALRVFARKRVHPGREQGNA